MAVLVIGRKPGEYVFIGDDIYVKVIRSDRGGLRLAIAAPKDVGIVRGEVFEEHGGTNPFGSVKA